MTWKFGLPRIDVISTSNRHGFDVECRWERSKPISSGYLSVGDIFALLYSTESDDVKTLKRK